MASKIGFDMLSRSRDGLSPVWKLIITAFRLPVRGARVQFFLASASTAARQAERAGVPVDWFEIGTPATTNSRCMPASTHAWPVLGPDTLFHHPNRRGARGQSRLRPVSFHRGEPLELVAVRLGR